MYKVSDTVSLTWKWQSKQLENHIEISVESNEYIITFDGKCKKRVRTLPISVLSEISENFYGFQEPDRIDVSSLTSTQFQDLLHLIDTLTH